LEGDVRLDIHNSDVPLLCRACEARHKGVCGALDASQLTRLARHTKRREVGPGTELVAASERAERYANILTGVVKLSKLMPDGRQQIVGLQFAPDFLGRLFSESSEVTAEAAGAVRICSFPRATLEEMMRQSPELVRRLHEQALRELDEARDWMLTVGRKTAVEKVASFLLLIARNVDPEADEHAMQFDIPLGRSDIADFLGLTIETVSRQLTRLRKEGLIRVEGNRRVTIVDYARLKEASGT
jgi:CRP/FNR family transcriptional regulator